MLDIVCTCECECGRKDGWWWRNCGSICTLSHSREGSLAWRRLLYARHRYHVVDARKEKGDSNGHVVGNLHFMGQKCEEGGVCFLNSTMQRAPDHARKQANQKEYRLGMSRGAAGEASRLCASSPPRISRAAVVVPPVRHGRMLPRSTL